MQFHLISKILGVSHTLHFLSINKFEFFNCDFKENKSNEKQCKDLRHTLIIKTLQIIYSKICKIFLEEYSY